MEDEDYSPEFNHDLDLLGEFMDEDIPRPSVSKTEELEGYFIQRQGMITFLKCAQNLSI